MPKRETFKFPILNLLPFSIGNKTQNSYMGFSFKMVDKLMDLKLTCYYFLKTLNI